MHLPLRRFHRLCTAEGSALEKSVSTPTANMGAAQAKETSKSTRPAPRAATEAVGGIHYDSKWTPSPSPTPPPSRVARHRPDPAPESGADTAAVSTSDIGKVPEHPKRVRTRRGRKRSSSRPDKGTKVKRRASHSSTKSRPTSRVPSQNALPPIEPALEPLVSPYSPPQIGGPHLADDGPEDMPIVVQNQSMTAAAAALSLSTTGTHHLRFALTGHESGPSSEALASPLDSAIARYPLAASTRSPANRPVALSTPDKSRTSSSKLLGTSDATSITSDVPPTTDVNPLEMLQLSMKATALQTPQFASPYLVTELFETVEQDSDVEAIPAKLVVSKKCFSPPPALPEPRFSPLEGFDLELEEPRESPNEQSATAPVPAMEGSRSLSASRRPLPSAPMDSKKSLDVQDAFATYQAWAEAEKLATSTSSAKAKRNRNSVAEGARYAQADTPPPYHVLANVIADRLDLPVVRPLRLHQSLRPGGSAGLPSSRKQAAASDESGATGRPAKKTARNDARRTDRPASSKAKKQAAGLVRMKQYYDPNWLVFESSPSNASPEQRSKDTAHAADRVQRDADAGEQVLAKEKRADGRLGSEFKKGFDRGEISNWLSGLSAEEEEPST